MKKILVLIAIACLAFVFASCEKDGGASNYSKLIIGTWDQLRKEGINGETGKHYSIDYVSNDIYWAITRWVFDKEILKKCYVSKEDGTESDIWKCKYEIINGELFVAGEYEGTITKLNKEELVITYKEDENSSFSFFFSKI